MVVTCGSEWHRYWRKVCVLWVTSPSTLPLLPAILRTSAFPALSLSTSRTLHCLVPPSASVSPSMVCDGLGSPGTGVYPHTESQVHVHLCTCAQVLNPHEYHKCKCVWRDVQAHCACTCACMLSQSLHCRLGALMQCSYQ